MAKPFMDEDFLLQTPTARTLYHEYAAPQPILDYHCHLPAAEIAGNIRFRNITELWLGGDHYKWRFMRSAGVGEDFITGDQPDQEKFRRFCAVLPLAVGNPLYHWCHLELRRFFDQSALVSADTADFLWDACNARLETPEFSARSLMLRANVRVACTTDDPLGDLAHHQAIAADSGFTVKVLTTFRPDRAFNIERADFADYISRLGDATGLTISRFADVMRAQNTFRKFNIANPLTDKEVAPTLRRARCRPSTTSTGSPAAGPRTAGSRRSRRGSITCATPS